MFEGGIPSTSFVRRWGRYFCGEGYVDDMIAMSKRYPDLNHPYWKDKETQYERINVPAYITAGWCHFHLTGAINGFRRISTDKKWLRCHRELEWSDNYATKNLTDLRTFFDRYLKDIYNGWELTPKVRIEVMDEGEHDWQTNRAEMDFPLPSTEYRKLYFDSKNLSMQEAPIDTESEISYDANSGEVCFDLRFDHDTEITGYMKLHLWVEVRGGDEMDLFVNVQKVGEDGETLYPSILGQRHPGAWGKCRVSKRGIDEIYSTEFNPVRSQEFMGKLKKHEIVPVEIGITPTSRIWHKGEYLRVQIAGRYIRDPWFENPSWETENHGNHVIHTGGQFDSYIQVPYIPTRRNKYN